MNHHYQDRALRTDLTPCSRAVRHALLALIGITCLSVLPWSDTYAQKNPVTAGKENYTIPAGPLGPALSQFAASAGVNIAIETAVVSGKMTQGIQGSFTAYEGLSRLLEKTGLEVVEQGNGNYSLRQASLTPQPEAVLPTVTVSGKGVGSTTEGTGSYTTWSTSSSTRLNLTPQETPQAITVLTRQRLDDQKLDNLTDALEATPGIIVQRPFIGQGQDSSDIYARGSYLRNYQIDGVPTSLAAGSFLASTAAYDRIEVVRGATGIMNGLGTPAATINLIRKRPTVTPQKSVTAQAGNWNRYGVGVDISNALNESGTARGRLVADDNQQGAWVKRFDQKNLALYGITEFDLSAQTLLTIGFNHLNQKTNSTISSRPLFFTNGQRIPLSQSANGSPAWDYYDQKSNNLFTSLEHRFDAGWVGKVEYSQTRYNNNMLTEGISTTVDAATGNGIEVWPYRSDSKTRQDNLDAYVSGVFSLFGRKHELISGVTLTRSRSTTQLYEDDWMNYPVNFNIYNWADTAPAPTLTHTSHDRMRERSYSAYLNARFQLGDATSLLLGNRFVNWELDETVRTRKENVFVPYVGLVHALNDIWSVYGSYTKIFQPQDGVVFLYGRPGVSPAPEQGEGYEVGTKASFYDGQLTASLALFQMDVANLAFWNRNTRFYEISGETQTRGIELELNGKLAEGWQIGTGYAYAKSKDENGQRTLTRLPLHSLKLFSTYRLPGVWNKLTLGGGINWQSAIRSASTPDYRQGGVALINLMARYEVDKNLSLTLHVNNALDKQYLSTVSNNYGTFGAPRNFMASMKYTF